jgi:phage major head subunit gpT-like protein
MIINRDTLKTLGIGFKASFQRGLDIAQADHQRVSSIVRSTTSAEEYGWLGKIPSVREWAGDRVIHSIAQYGYSIRNRDWESTQGVDRNHIEDDNLGNYDLIFAAQGEVAGAHNSALVYEMLASGFSNLCYDGQPYFDTDHPVLDKSGAVTSVANTDATEGSGPAWFLMDDRRVIKPVILQIRRDFDFVSMDRPNDDNVFWQKKFLYGIDGRMNAGFSFWQFCWGSKQPLNAANYSTARAAVSRMKGDYGRPLGLRPNLLVVPPDLEGAGRKILRSELGANGETTEWAGTAELFMSPWLA